MSFKIGIVGLGNMGKSFAERLSGVFDIRAFDISSQVRKNSAKNLNVVGNLKELVRESEVIILSLPGSPQVELVVNEILSIGVTGKTIIDLSTSYPLSNQNLSKKVAGAGGRYLDAPVSGNMSAAEKGEVITMVGGDGVVFNEMLPIFDRISSKVNYIGGPGQGNTMKIALVYLSVMNTILGAELIPFIEKMGMDTSLYREMVGGSGGNSKNFMGYTKRMIEHDFKQSYQIGLANKDVSYMERLFTDLGLEGILVNTGADFLKRAVDSGMENLDMAEIVSIKRKEYQLEN